MKKLLLKKRDLNAPKPERELPFDGNAAYLPYEQGEFTSIYDSATDELRDKILSLGDSAPKTDTVYYVSYKGNDENDGLSPESAWYSTARLEDIKTRSTVLFERGGVYRGAFKLKSNVSYGAYGSGPKPCIYGSLQNYAEPELWKQESENIWSITIEGSKDIGSITFDDGIASALRVMNREELDRDYLYYYENGTAYLYFSIGNPAEYFSDIEIMDLAFAPNVMIGGHAPHDITIENLCLKYGNFGIQMGGMTRNITIRGCEIGYIGGCLMPDGIVRWGNGVEIWAPSENIVIEDCWVYQCYDTGITHQCNEEGWPMNNIRFTGNLIEFCQYAIEAYNGVSNMKNILYNKNILRFSGYQVYDPKKRHGSDSSFTSLICTPWKYKKHENFVIEDNIFDTSYGYIIRGAYFNLAGGMVCRNNSYLQQTGLNTYLFDEDAYKIVPSVAKLEDGVVYTALNQEELEEGVALIDICPKSVVFQNKKEVER